jgi:pyrimidine operon attenuation protein/uracil phosphoribosyltransferase
LINRGGAQLPICPQITGANIPLQPHQAFQLSVDTSGKFHLCVESQEHNDIVSLDQPNA